MIRMLLLVGLLVVAWLLLGASETISLLIELLRVLIDLLETIQRGVPG